MDTEIRIKRHREDFMDANGVVVPYEDDTQILGLFGKYRPLSNFHEARVIIDGLEFQTSEAAYMAQKTDVLEEKIRLTKCMTGREAKAYGQKVTLRPGWDTLRVEAMEKVLRAKFDQSEDLRGLLLSTGNKWIEETNWWGDRFWGAYAGEGENQLGKALMRVREWLWTEYYSACE